MLPGNIVYKICQDQDIISDNLMRLSIFEGLKRVYQRLFQDTGGQIEQRCIKNDWDVFRLISSDQNVSNKSPSLL